MYYLSKIFEASLDPQHPSFGTAAYHGSLNNLQNKICAIQSDNTGTSKDLEEPFRSEKIQLTKMYKIASLIYLERCGRNTETETTELTNYINAAFRLLVDVDVCEELFPLLTFGFEANTDQRRLQILKLISRAMSQNTDRARHIAHVRTILTSAWIQDDLGTVWLNRWKKMQHLFGLCDSMPVFV